MKNPRKIVTFSTLFPNNMEPSFGIFVANRLKKLLATGEVETRVIAPVPWFPVKHPRFGQYSKYAGVVRHETIRGIDVRHPRFPVIPKIGMTIAPFLLALFVFPAFVSLLRKKYQFQLIDAHYFYPDGVAAIIIGKLLRKPVFITARGTDINLIPKYYLPRRMILWAASQCEGMITVCQALKDRLVEIGADGNRITVLRNGVDLEVFQPPQDRDLCRAEQNLQKTTLLSVGHLIDRKGHDLAIQSLSYLPEYELLVAGDGPEKKKLEDLVLSLNLGDRVRFLGSVEQSRLVKIYGAVDALVLASSREGWANVLLEAMACGTPVVASNVWGTPEVVATREAGRLMTERTPMELANAVKSLFADYPDRSATRLYAEQFSWEATTQGQLKLFAGVQDPG